MTTLTAPNRSEPALTRAHAGNHYARSPDC
jgi:hypothetical protein